MERELKMIEKIDNNTIKISGRIDSNNAAAFEKELFWNDIAYKLQ